MRRHIPPPQKSHYEIVNPTWLPIIDELPSFAYLAAHAATYGMDRESINYTQDEWRRALKLATKLADAKAHQGFTDEIRTAWSDLKDVLSGFREFKTYAFALRDKIADQTGRFVTILQAILNLSNFIVDVIAVWKLYQTDPKFAIAYLSVKALNWSIIIGTAAVKFELLDWVLQLIQPKQPLPPLHDIDDAHNIRIAKDRLSQSSAALENLARQENDAKYAPLRQKWARENLVTPLTSSSSAPTSSTSYLYTDDDSPNIAGEGGDASDQHIFVTVFKQISHIFTNTGDPTVTIAQAKRVQTLFGSMNSVATFAKHAKDFVIEIVSLITYMLFGDGPAEHRREAIMLLRDAQKLIHSDSTSDEYLTACKALIVKCDALEEHLITHDYRQLTPQFSRVCETLRLRISALESILGANANKVEAVGINLTSTPGLGKGSMLKAITIRSAKLANIPVDDDPVYMFPLVGDFHDSLRPDAHIAVVQDEFLMTTDATKLSNQSDFAIAMVGGTSMKAAHSEAAKKMRHAFKHLIYVVLTNASMPIEKSFKLQYLTPFTRRFWNVHATCTHPAYDPATGKWSVNVVEGEDFYALYYRYAVSEFIVRNQTIQLVHTKKLSYIEFCNFVAQQLRIKQDNFNRLASVIKNPLPTSLFSFTPKQTMDILLPRPSEKSFEALTTFLKTTSEEQFVRDQLSKWMKTVSSEYLVAYEASQKLLILPTKAGSKPPTPEALDQAQSRSKLAASTAFETAATFLMQLFKFIEANAFPANENDFAVFCSTISPTLRPDDQLVWTQLTSSIKTQVNFHILNAATSAMTGLFAGLGILTLNAVTAHSDSGDRLLGPTRIHNWNRNVYDSLLNNVTSIVIDHHVYTFTPAQAMRLMKAGWFTPEPFFRNSIVLHAQGWSVDTQSNFLLNHPLCAYLGPPGPLSTLDISVLCVVMRRVAHSAWHFTPTDGTQTIIHDPPPGRVAFVMRGVPTPEGVAIVESYEGLEPDRLGTCTHIVLVDNDYNVLTALKVEFNRLGWLPQALAASALTMGLTFAATLLMNYLLKWFLEGIFYLFNPRPVKVEITVANAEGKTYETGQPAKQQRKEIVIPTPMIVGQGAYESFNSKSLAEQLAIINNNEFDCYLSYIEPDTGILYTQTPFLVRFIAGTTFQTVYHSMHYHLTHAKELSTFVLKKRMWESQAIPLSLCKIVRMAMPGDQFVQDTLFVNIPPRYIQPKRDIIEYFPKRDQITDAYLHNTKMIIPDVCGTNPTLTVKEITDGKFLNSYNSRSELRDGSLLLTTVTNAVVFSGLSKGGQCNSLYASDNPKITTPFFAYHDAGDSATRKQYAGLLYQELLRAGCASVEPSALPLSHPITGESILTDQTVSPSHPQACLLLKNTLPAGTTTKEFHHHLNSKNTIIRTPLFPDEVPSKGPADLSFQALLNAQAKADRPDFHVRNPMYPIACLKYQRRLIKIKPVTNILLTTDEVLNGALSSLHSHPIRILTSPGWLKPLCKGSPGKTALIHDDGLHKTLTPLCQLARDRYSAEVDKGVPATVEQVNLKKELRTMDRVTDKLSREFFTGDLRDYIVGTEEFGAFWAAFDSDSTLTRCLVGINPSAQSWSKVQAELREGGRLLMQSDIKSNDIDAYRYNLWMMLQIIQAWYAHHDHRDPIIKAYHEKRRYNLWLAMMGRTTQIGSILQQHDHGVSSGKFRTTSLVSMLRHVEYMSSNMRLLYLHYPEDAVDIINDDERLYDTFRMFSYGDDSARSVLPIYPLINNNTQEDQLLDEHGIRITRTDKRVTEKPPPHYAWSEFEFLSRFALFRDCHWYAPLREDTIMNILYYREDDGVPDSFKLVECANSALHEWFQYGPERFAHERRRYYAELERLNIPALLTTFEKEYKDWFAGL